MLTTTKTVGAATRLLYACFHPRFLGATDDTQVTRLPVNRFMETGHRDTPHNISAP